MEGDSWYEVVHVAGEVDADARLLVVFDDDMERLHVKRLWSGCGEAFDSTDAEIILEASGDCSCVKLH